MDGKQIPLDRQNRQGTTGRLDLHYHHNPSEADFAVDPRISQSDFSQQASES